MIDLRLTRAFLLAFAFAACSDSTTSGNGDAGIDLAAGGNDLAGGGGLDLAGSGDGGNNPGADGGLCPDVFGTYGTIMTTGAGCGDLNSSAPQCIKGLTAACALHFTSAPPGGTGAVNGGAQLQSDGSFSNASLIFGTVQRSGCTGQWDAASSTMTVDCGGTGSSQSCVVTMVRSSTTCP